MKRKSEDWYANELMIQFQEGVDDVDLQPVNLSLPHLKELTAKWMVKAANHISNNPQVIVNGFMRAGISKALDGIEESESEDASAHDSESMSSSSSDDDDNVGDDLAPHPTVTNQSDTEQSDEDSDIIILD